MNTERVEMLTQEHCGQCRKLKEMLEESGLQVEEIPYGKLYERGNRAEMMAALSLNDCRFPVMHLRGSESWTGDVQEVLHEAHKRLERGLCAAEQSL